MISENTIKELNELYFEYFTLKKKVFRPKFMSKKMNYEELSVYAGEISEKINNIYQQHINDKDIPKLFSDFIQNLSCASGCLAVYLGDKEFLEKELYTKDDVEKAFNELYYFDKQLTKSAKKLK